MKPSLKFVQFWWCKWSSVNILKNRTHQWVIQIIIHKWIFWTKSMIRTFYTLSWVCYQVGIYFLSDFILICKTPRHRKIKYRPKVIETVMGGAKTGTCQGDSRSHAFNPPCVLYHFYVLFTIMEDSFFQLAQPKWKWKKKLDFSQDTYVFIYF